VAEEVIRRRFERGLFNFEKLYMGLVDEWAIYDNSGKMPILLNEGSRS